MVPISFYISIRERLDDIDRTMEVRRMKKDSQIIDRVDG